REGARVEELDEARAARAAAARRLEDAERELGRTRRLYEGGAVSRQSWENAETAVRLARSEHERATARLRLLESGPRAETVAAQAAAVRQASAAAAQIEAALDNTVLRAPFDGVVTVRHRDVGEIVAPGVPVVSLLDPGDRWVRIYVQGDRVGRIGLGRRASITDDAHAGRRYEGEVVHIADEAEFTPRNVQTREERVKLVYAVRVAITGDPDYDLKPGLPVDVRVPPADTGDDAGGDTGSDAGGSHAGADIGRVPGDPR
ncbi:MAG: HlyD family secretion protein, partial [Gemmatimonadota bacterium]